MKGRHDAESIGIMHACWYGYLDPERVKEEIEGIDGVNAAERTMY